MGKLRLLLILLICSGGILLAQESETAVDLRNQQQRLQGARDAVTNLSGPARVQLIPGYQPFDNPQSQLLYDNGPLINSHGTGVGGADESVLQTVTLGMNTLGFGHQAPPIDNRIADEFTVTDASGWSIDSLVFWAYQTGSPTTSTITGVFYQIWDGDPSDPNSTVVFGDLTTNRLIRTVWSNIYRVTETTTGTASDRPIMRDVASGGFSLGPGTYWIAWQTAGTLSSGPWIPPITINGQATTGNALQYLATTGAWGPANDTGSQTQQGMPFLVFGAVAGDPSDPNPPDNAVAYSDYTTPTGMLLTWSDPTTLVDGTPISPSDFTIEIERDGAFLTSVPGGTETFTDAGLTDGQMYEYTLFAKLVANDSTSATVTTSWIAGGSPVPDGPTNFFITISAVDNDLVMHWMTPSTNVDGTPMDDFAGINLYEDGVIATTFARTPADTGRADSAAYTPPAGTHQYFVTVIDNEVPPNESVPSNTAFSPIGLPFFDDFPNSGVPNAGFWINEDAEVNSLGVNPPSAPFVLSLDGFPHAAPEVGDKVTLLPVDFSGLAGQGAVLSFWYQPQGTGNAPEATDSLAVDFLNDLGQWITVRHYPGRTVVPFINEVISVDGENPGPGATFFYPAFQFRFRNRATVSNTTPFDHWLIDNVFLGVPTANPSMVVGPQSLVDTLLVNGSSTVNFSVSNNNPTPSTLSYSIAEDPAVSWLSVNPSSGSLASGESDVINVDLDATGLPAATYMTNLIVSGNDTTNSADTVAVTMVVNDAPVIGVTPDSIDATLPPDSTTTRTLTVHNTGAGPLNFTIEFEEVTAAKGVRVQRRLSVPKPQEQVHLSNSLPDDAPHSRLTGLLPVGEVSDRVPYYHPDMSAGQIPDLIYYKFNEVGTNRTKNFAKPATRVSDSADVLGGLSMGGTGQFGAALIGSGGSSTTDFVDSRWATDLPGDWAISMWVNNMTTTALSYFFGDVNAASFRCFTAGVAGTNNLMLRGGGLNDVLITGVGPGPSVVDIVYDSSVPEVRAFVNGDLNNTVAQPLVSISGTGPFKVGGYSTLVGIPANSLMDEFKMWNRVPSGVDWLNADTLSGTVPAGGTLDIIITFNPAGLLGGDYNADVVFMSNDPVTPEFRVAAHMFVVGQVSIATDPDSLIFPDPVFVNGSDSRTLNVLNNGNGLLTVSNITSSNPDFTVTPTQFDVPPFSSVPIEVTFSPAATGTSSGNLSISSNDPGSPLEVYVEGEGIFGPEIGVNPDSLNQQMLVGTTADVSVAISNDAPVGAASLQWSARVRAVTAPQHPSLVIPPATLDYPRGIYPPSAGPAPHDGHPAENGRDPSASPLVNPGVGYGIESSNAAFDRMDLNVPEVLVTIAPQTGTGGFAGAGAFGPGDQSFVYQLDNDNYFAQIDTASGAATVLPSPIAPAGETWSGLEIDPTTGILYGLSTNVTTSTLSVIDPATGAVTVIGQTGMAGGIALAIDGNGDMWSYDIVSDQFFSVDKNTGVATVVGPLGFDANFGQGMAWDPVSGVVYMAAFNNGAFQPELRIVDTSTGSSVLVGVIGVTVPGGTTQFGWISIPGAGGPSFIELLDPTSGTIAPGDVQALMVRLNALDVPDTTYHANIEISSNDPTAPILIVPVTLVVSDSLVGVGTVGQLPRTFAVSRNYPNPFNPSTSINFQLPQVSDVKLVIYNVLGQKVRTLVSRRMEAGFYKSEWNGLNDAGQSVASGIYIYRFEAGDFLKVQKMILLK